MSKNRNRIVTRRKGQVGIALLEAMVALAIAVAGLLALMGLNARVAGMNVNNRLSSAAMLAAQSKLEELRNTDFTALASGNDTVSFQSPGLMAQMPVAINRCWVVAPAVYASKNMANLAQVTVAAVGQGKTCDTAAGAGASARLVTLIAKTNPRIAARNAASSVAADGAGKLVKFDPKGQTKTGETPGGFNTYRNDSTGATTFVNPETGQGLTTGGSGDGPLLVAFINGNIMFDRALTVAEFERLQIQAEGNAICRKFYPGSLAAGSPNQPEPPKITGGGQTLSFVQYSCVVSDGWRRSVLVSPPGVMSNSGTIANDKVCVGYPDMQGTSVADVLESAGRQYVGRKEGVSPNPYELSGMRGSVNGANSQIGSLCEPNASPSAGDCWYDTTNLGARGWVPGGHHYFVMSGTGGLCSSRMSTVLAAIDESNAGRGGTVWSNYRGYLVRNPHKVYCANTKTYTNALPKIPFGQEFTSDNCYSYTKLSGFMTPSTTVDVDPSQIVFGSSSTYAVPCAPMGAFGAKGGSYACGYPEDAADIRVTPVISGYTLSPSRYSGLNPLDFNHDIVSKSFTIGSIASSCAAVNAQAWNTNCNAPLVATADGQSITVSNTASGYTGTATFTCTGTTWGSATNSSCTPVASGCAAVTATWNTNCSSSLAATANGQSITVSNAASGYTGSATFTCTGTTWGSATGATCTPVAATKCAATTLNWSSGNGNACSGPVGETNNGSTAIATNTNPGVTGSATFACTGTTWSGSPTDSSCLSVCQTLVVAGSRQNQNAKVAISGFSCSYPSNSKYTCSKSLVNEGVSVTVTQTDASGKNSVNTFTVQKGDCDHGVNF